MSDLKRISPRDAKDLMDAGYTYVDVRSEPEFEAGHPAGSINVPIAHMGPGGMTPNPDFVDVVDAALGKRAKIVVGCKSGGRSLRAAQALSAAGFTDVVDQRAGWDGVRDPFGKVSEPGWSTEGLPAETGATAGRTYDDVRARATGATRKQGRTL